MPQPTEAPAERPLWTRPGLVVSIAVALVIGIAGIVVTVSTLDNDGRGTVSAPSSAGSGSGISTPPPAAPTAVPTVAPGDVRWELVGAHPVPLSDSAGPTKITATTASGFTHTPVGALIAAAQIAMRCAGPRRYWEPAIERQLVPSADRERLLAAMAAVRDESIDSAAQSDIAGFSYQSYTPDTAVIGLVLRAPSVGAPQFHVLSLTLLWRDGDWRMQAPPGGAWISVNRRTSDLTGVVEWGPQ
ncbi:hypothetical protein OG271_27395 [Micromonospora rifamycinica]|uniref:hypothetical protein n=1 Tax=Micromonospora rifamycinica TaxID=291594 RepID=UPI002E2B9E51|nr:hypothetical protein [Micromonospora rifamycinica]